MSGHGPRRGDRLGDYVLHEPVWVAPAATVWAAEGRTGTPVQVTVLADGDLPVDEPARTLDQLRSTRPDRVAALLEDSGDGVPRWFATALPAGPTLAEVLASRTLDRAAVLRTVAAAAEGLADLHARGVVHGDLTSEHVLVPQAGSAVLLDAGVTWMTRRSRAADRLALPSWRARDLLALGQVLAEALGGVRALRTGIAPVLLPRRLHRLVVRLLDDDPAGRPEAADAAEELHRIVAAPGLRQAVERRRADIRRRIAMRDRFFAWGGLSVVGVFVFGVAMLVVGMQPAASTDGAPRADASSGGSAIRVLGGAARERSGVERARAEDRVPTVSEVLGITRAQTALPAAARPPVPAVPAGGAGRPAAPTPGPSPFPTGGPTATPEPSATPEPTPTQVPEPTPTAVPTAPPTSAPPPPPETPEPTPTATQGTPEPTTPPEPSAAPIPSPSSAEAEDQLG